VLSRLLLLALNLSNLAQLKFARTVFRIKFEFILKGCSGLL